MKSYLRLGSSNPGDMPPRKTFLAERGMKSEFDCPSCNRRYPVSALGVHEDGILREEAHRDLTLWCNPCWHGMSESERQAAVNEARNREVDVLHEAALLSDAADAHNYIKP